MKNHIDIISCVEYLSHKLYEEINDKIYRGDQICQ